jgi:hypothetical protein
VSQALANNEQMKAYLTDLERPLDAGISEASVPDLPPSAEIISDPEHFFRQQGRQLGHRALYLSWPSKTGASHRPCTVGSRTALGDAGIFSIQAIHAAPSR